MTNVLTQANRQWASRPDDQRFTSMIDLTDFCESQKNISAQKVVSSRSLEFAPDENDPVNGLHLIGPEGNLKPTNWGFGQIARHVGAPPAYLNTLPAFLAADNLNHGLKFGSEISDMQLLYTRGNDPEFRAGTGANYGRIWNADIARAIKGKFGDGITGDWTVPGEFGKAVTVDKRNTTLYASDRDMFIFLADETNRIEIPNRRDGKSGSLARGFFAWNSEVGNATFGLAKFYFDYVCQNRMVWGVDGFSEIKIRHTVSAPDRYLEEVMPLLTSYSHESAMPIVDLIKNAQTLRVDDLKDFAASRFSAKYKSAKFVDSLSRVHILEENRPVETVFDVTTAMTAFARELPHADARVDLEREAGRIMALAS